MKIQPIIISLLALCMLVACSGMNDNIDQYLSQGEIIYIAKPDSVHLFAGRERFKMDFWVRDPRATGLTVYWSLRSQSQTIPLPPGRDMDEPVEVIIDRNTPEGQYALILITEDGKGNYSIPDEENVAVYGELFQNSLNNRLVDSHSVKGNTVTLNWGNCYSAQEVGICVRYTDTAGAACEVLYPTDELGPSSVLSNVDVSREISYSTLYLPEKTAIDTFSTQKTVIAL
ncbi:MAG: hypothetical protein IJ654_08460 [Bacteroidales bacterium]|nr:hypothetical protein [Bacteroidales bacterium]